jgi:hypothetical protein
MAGGDAVTPVASGARTTNGNSGPIALPDKGAQLHALLNVTAASGTTPSMTLTVEWSHDGTNFAALEAAADGFTAVTAAGAKVKTFPVRGPFFRFVWAITGTTPSLTFSVSSYVTL